MIQTAHGCANCMCDSHVSQMQTGSSCHAPASAQAIDASITLRSNVTDLLLQGDYHAFCCQSPCLLRLHIGLQHVAQHV